MTADIENQKSERKRAPAFGIVSGARPGFVAYL